MNNLQIVDLQADAEFKASVDEVFGPSSTELDYVEHELRHIGHMFTSGICTTQGRVLEYGCNVGATAIVLASLGGEVTAVDVNPTYLDIARLNARRFGKEIQFVEIVPNQPLPFLDAAFDLIVCNSVLEYVYPEHRKYVQSELYRILAPGGRILVYGTSNRLWPQEKHSRRWFNNYCPLAIDRITGRRRERGVWPWQIRHGFGPMTDVLKRLGPESMVTIKKDLGHSGKSLRMLRALSLMAHFMGTSAGFLLPWMMAVLEKSSPKKE